MAKLRHNGWTQHIFELGIRRSRDLVNLLCLILSEYGFAHYSEYVHIVIESDN